MSHPERGKLIPVTGNNDTPQTDEAIDVQFNPTSLKVSLSNTLKENQRNGNSRAAQFVDKSSSTLTVELLFDTTYMASSESTEESDSTGSGSEASSSPTDAGSSGSRANQIEQGSDVRNLTKKIAETFLKPQAASNNRKKAPKRCLFQWGSFEFVGLIESYDETLDFFSKEGRPLRATLSLKLKEDRFQFRQRTDGVAAAETSDPPTLTPTGNNDDKSGAGSGNPGGDGAGGDSAVGDNRDGPGGGGDEAPAGDALTDAEGAGAEKAAALAPNQNTQPLPGSSGNQKAQPWRETALFNGCENPRFPSGPLVAVPSQPMSSAVQLKGVGNSQGIPSLPGQPHAPTPAFRFGASDQLGTNIPGAFSPTGASSTGGAKAHPLNAGDIINSSTINGSTPLRDIPQGSRPSRDSSNRPPPPIPPGVGFD
ncbi:hypothetical protein [Marinibactrum halimedae]|uniref:Contractile injection system tube protein N-terminal domain-containing protein n=1 Tax=Marinibactrum halimedae TaxID=1444977 RepID=A0AA37WNS0_9GAMM|nr:hypothetical protein [Marinibactrum halimedae]MCD9460629.1 hypothetical protein [Marinibactrum halimedae]GLS27845.1 hypothetical protein GCM10007877_35640 [Marinibactrum halimedae]